MTSQERFKEVGGTFVWVLILIILFALSTGLIPFVADLLYAIVAFIFIKVAQWRMDKLNLSSEECGITWNGLGRGVAWGLGATIVTLPFFVAGFILWETEVGKRTFAFELDNYWHWPLSLEGEPRSWGQEAGVWVWGQKQTLNVGVRNTNSPNNRVILESSTPFTPTTRGSLVLTQDSSAKTATRWTVTPSARGRGVVQVSDVCDISVRVEPVLESNPTWPLFLGRNQSLQASPDFDAKRNLWWILLWVATQFLLIAYPEEYFYRGWMQSRLQLAFEARAREKGKTAWSWFGFTPAIVLTSVLFGLGHLLVPIGGQFLATRMSVFFPSLIFGWLRHHTGSITAAVVYHAFANLMVLMMVVHVS